LLALQIFRFNIFTRIHIVDIHFKNFSFFSAMFNSSATAAVVFTEWAVAQRCNGVTRLGGITGLTFSVITLSIIFP
jgi:hypothetical protein